MKKISVMLAITSMLFLMSQLVFVHQAKAVTSYAQPPIVSNTTTAEDTPSALQITPNAADGTNVKFYKISSIIGGSLYKNDGTSEILNGDYITASEGNAGLKFSPAADTNSNAGGTYSFNVQAAFDTTGTDLSTATPAFVTVYEVNDPPIANNEVLAGVDENTGELAIPFASLLANDSPGPANESGQSLTITSVNSPMGGSVRIQDTHVYFTPDFYYHGAASFKYTVQDDGTTNGAPDPKSAQATASFTINQVANTPVVTSAETAEDTQSTSGLVINPHYLDNTAVTHFKIQGITGGTLYKHDGATVIHNGNFITAAEGGDGLMFTPATNASRLSGDWFSFLVQASLDGAGKGLSAEALATVTVTEVNDPPTAADDVLSAIQEDSGDRTIPFVDLVANDTPGPANESGQSLTISSVTAGTGGTVRIVGTNVIFTPAPYYHGTADFQYRVQDNGTTNGVADYKAATATVSFAINPVANTPNVTDAQTPEDTMSTGGLVITRNAVDGSEVTHFKITEITGGTLYKNDGLTPIHDGDFITVADGAAGLKFTPAANANSPSGDTFTFKVQGTLDSAGTGISNAAPAPITVSEVNDPPIAANDVLTAVPENSDERAIAMEGLLANDKPGPANENGQTLKITSVGNPVGGMVRMDGSKVYFKPYTNYYGSAGFDYMVEDNGTTNGVLSPQTATATASFTIEPRAEMPSVMNAVTAEDTQSTSGLVITPTAGSGATTVFFKISEIMGGTLYLNNGTTPVQNGEYITVADGGAGLTFMPAADTYGTAGFGFKVQAAPGTDGTLLSDAVPASITVSEVNDPPIAVDDLLSAINENSGDRTIPISALLINDTPGPANESGQTLTITAADHTVGGSVRLDNTGTNVIFTPSANFNGTASFRYVVQDNGTTNGVADYKAATATVSFAINPIADVTITKVHSGTLEQGQTASYTLQINNVGSGQTAGDVTVTDMLPSGLTATALSGSGWSCNIGTLVCTRSDALAAGSSYPAITLMVNVASDAAPSLTNRATVGGGGETNITNNTAMDSASVTARTVVSLSSNLPAVLIQAGQSASTVITVTYSDHTQANVTPYVTWNVQSPAIASVNNGTITGISPGSTVIQAVYGGKSVDLYLTVTAIPVSLQSLSANPQSIDIQNGQTASTVVTATYSNNTQTNVTPYVTWNVQSAAIASVNNGTITGLSPGSTVVQAVYGGMSVDLYLTVTAMPVSLQSLRANPQSIAIQYGQTASTVITATYSNSTQVNVTPYVTWNVESPTIASVKNGVITGISAGSTVIQAVYGGKSVPISVTVSFGGGGDDSNSPQPSLPPEQKLPLTGGNGSTPPSPPPVQKQTDSAFSGVVNLDEMTNSIKNALASNRQVSFKDTGSHWGSADITLAARLGFVEGYADGTFEPDTAITRGEFSALIARAFHLTPGTGNTAFTDTQGNWAQSFIHTLASNGFITGYGDGTFMPTKEISRAEMMQIISRILNLKQLKTNSAKNFSDVSQQYWAKVVIDDAASAGIIQGEDDAHFAPDMHATRTESIIIILRALKTNPTIKSLLDAGA